MKLQINNFQRGKTSSPYVSGAFWKSANLDIHGLDGLARINYLPTAVAGSGDAAIAALPVSFTSLSGVGGDIVFTDYNKPVKRLDFPSTITKIGNANFDAANVINWKGYILANYFTILKATAISANMNGAWTQISTGLDNVGRHNMFSSIADKNLYICNGNKVASLIEEDGQTFDPTNAETFTLTLAAITLQTGYAVKSIEEMGRFLVLFCDITSQNRTAILFWDRVSTTLDAMYEIKEPNMVSTLEHHGTIYITGGLRGNIYKLTESGLSHYVQIKVDDYDNQKYVLTGVLPSLSATYPYQTLAWWKDKLMVVTNMGASGIEPGGIYSVKDGKVNHEFLCSNGVATSSNTLSSIMAWGDYLVYGWWDGSTTYSLDVIRDDNNRLPSGCYFETPMLRAGYKLGKNNVSRIEAVLARPLQTGEGLTIKYRRNINDSWTTLGEKTYTTDGAQSTLVFNGIQGIENLQIRCEMITASTSKNTPYLLEITLF